VYVFLCLEVGATTDKTLINEVRNAPLKHVLYAIAENYRQQKDFPNALYWGEKALAEDPDNYRHQELVAEVKKQMK